MTENILPTISPIEVENEKQRLIKFLEDEIKIMEQVDNDGNEKTTLAGGFRLV